VFALAHVLRRPIVVYGSQYIGQVQTKETLSGGSAALREELMKQENTVRGICMSSTLFLQPFLPYQQYLTRCLLIRK
jgi:hypothetical protein